MTIVIPAWILWCAGGVACLAVLALAAIGVVFCWAFRDGFHYR